MRLTSYFAYVVVFLILWTLIVGFNSGNLANFTTPQFYEQNFLSNQSFSSHYLLNTTFPNNFPNVSFGLEMNKWHKITENSYNASQNYFYKLKEFFGWEAILKSNPHSLKDGEREGEDGEGDGNELEHGEHIEEVIKNVDTADNKEEGMIGDDKMMIEEKSNQEKEEIENQRKEWENKRQHEEKVEEEKEEIEEIENQRKEWENKRQEEEKEEEENGEERNVGRQLVIEKGTLPCQTSSDFIYWKKIPSDLEFISPYLISNQKEKKVFVWDLGF